MSSKSDPKPSETPSPIGEISQEPSALENFLDANQKKLVIVGITAILVLVGYVVVDGLKEMNRRDNAAAVAAARTVPDYDKVSEELEGTTPGGSALLLKSKVLWNDQQQQEAIDTVNKFISSYPEHPALGSAYASLGSYQQQLGNLTEAKEAFQKSAETESAASSLALLALGDLARTAGEEDKAKEYYDRIISEYEDSHFQVKSLARQRIELIGVKAPTEKAPEPADLNPGNITPPAGGPTLTPKPASVVTPAVTPTDPKPTEQPAPTETTPEEMPAETPADDKPVEDAPAQPAGTEEPSQEIPAETPDSPDAPATGESTEEVTEEATEEAGGETAEETAGEVTEESSETPTPGPAAEDEAPTAD